MRALVFDRPGSVAVVEREYPAPRPGEVTIRVKVAGICGTDLHIYEDGFISPFPIIPGHEFSGVIDQIGEDVSGWRIGERVSADPGLFCGECLYCRSNRGNHCLHWSAIGVKCDGAMAEYVRVPASHLVRLPDSISFAEAALIEPMACVVYAMNRLQLCAGDSVLLFGAGSMGQMLIQSLVQSGAGLLAVADLSADKVEMARSFGATHGYVSDGTLTQRLQQDFPYGFDAVIDATGVASVIQRALEHLGPTGKYLQFGVSAPDAKIELNPFTLYNKDWTLLGTMAINHTFLAAFDWVKSGRFALAPLISDTLTLDEAPAFFAGQRHAGQLKVQIAF